MWMKIGSAILIGAMLIYLFPRAKQMLQQSPEGSSDDWRTFTILIVIVGLFVLLLTKLV